MYRLELFFILIIFFIRNTQKINLFKFIINIKKLEIGKKKEERTRNISYFSNITYIVISCIIYRDYNRKRYIYNYIIVL